MSLNVRYTLDLFGNMSKICVDTYSYELPIKGLVSENGYTDNYCFVN